MAETIAKTLMVQGTASNVGKSILVAALCRHFSNVGLKVAPFKSQNMSNNSAVTPDGHEIGRAQAVQAQAARAVLRVEMNPILIKPEAEQRSQIVVNGKPLGSMQAREYYQRRLELRPVIEQSLNALRAENELVIIEGAGSPAEVNLKAQDLVNMHVARLADAPVLLVGDIDRGGVFASLIGTLMLLDESERERVAALVINKFRGDISLLTSGLEFLEEHTGKDVLGVVPHVPDLQIPDEDSVALENRSRPTRPEQLDIVVVRLPHISNYDDVLPLEREASVNVRFVDQVELLGEPELVIIPGSKATLADLQWLMARGFGDVLTRRAAKGQPILGICGGCQMLGDRLLDPEHVESSIEQMEGLQLLPLTTRYRRQKVTADVAAVAVNTHLLGKEDSSERLSGFEIHMGEVSRSAVARAAFKILLRNGVESALLDGAVSSNGAVVGTMLHGILGNPAVRSHLLERLGTTGGRAPSEAHQVDAEFNRLAKVVGESLDTTKLSEIIGL